MTVYRIKNENALHPQPRFDFNACRYDLSTPTILFHTFEIFSCGLHRQEYLFPALQPNHQRNSPCHQGLQVPNISMASSRDYKAHAEYVSAGVPHHLQQFVIFDPESDLDGALQNIDNFIFVAMHVEAVSTFRIKLKFKKIICATGLLMRKFVRYT
jgi:hypothetical protein